MKKKIIISFLAIIIFAFPLQSFYIQHVDSAAVISKVATAVAKKTAKVPIRDITKDIAFEMLLQAIGQNFNEKSTYTFKEGYEGYCMTEIKSDGSCGRVVQIKKDLTTQDMTNIDKQIDVETDKAITKGKGLTRWQKFMDWFVPVWLVSFGATALTYALDGDVRQLFNEIGYNTLVSTGIIAPVQNPDEIMPIDAYAADENDNIIPSEVADGFQFTKTDTNRYLGIETLKLDLPVEGTIIDTSSKNSGVVTDVNVHTGFQGYGDLVRIAIGKVAHNKNMTIRTQSSSLPYPATITIAVDNEVKKSITYPVGHIANPTWTLTETELGLNMNSLEPTHHRIRLPYYHKGHYYTDHLLHTNQGRIHIQMKSETQPMLKLPGYYSGFTYTANESRGFTQRFTTGQNFHKVILVPPYEEIEEENPLRVAGVPTSQTIYESSTTGNIALVPPSAIPYTDSTGVTLTREPNPEPGAEPIYKTPTGTIVPSDDVVVGEPTISQTPEGVPTVIPEPTSSNPEPTPIPLTPTETTSTPTEPHPAPTNPTEPVEPTEPDNPTEPTDPNSPPPYIPDGESCSNGFEFPELEPLKETMSDAFPFSIPWDMQNALESAFGDIGMERPNFDLNLNMLGTKKTIKIGLPEFFDDWKPFTDTLLLFIFDIGIMFGIYRFMKGGGS